MRPLKVWTLKEKMPGTRRKSRYCLRWEELILGDDGRPVLDDRGKLKVRRREMAMQSTDKLTVNAEREKKYREINGIMQETEKDAKAEEQVVVLSELAKMDEQWLLNRERDERTAYLMALTFGHFIEVNGDLPITQVGPVEIERYITSRRAKVKPVTVNRELTELRVSFSRAVNAFQLLDKNPFTKAEKLTVAETKIHLIMRDEQQKLLDACQGDLELELFLRLVFDTGARANEIAWLPWANLDLEERIGQIECTATWRSKTRRNRPITWSPETNEKLREWRLRHPERVYVFNEEGSPKRKFYFYIDAKFRRALKRSQIKKCCLKDIRSTVGTRLAEEGVNQAIASKYLGHTDIATTAKFYQKIRPEVLRATLDKMKGTTGTTKIM